MKKVLLFTLLILIAVSAGFTTQYIQNPLSVGSFGILEQLQAVFVEPVKPDTVAFVGDIMLARHVERYLDKYGDDYVYSRLPVMGTSTILVGNFEAAIPKEHAHTPDETFSFSVDSAYIPALADYGFSYMSLANNHSYDKGVEDFVRTQEVLASSSIESFGEPRNLATSSISYVQLENHILALIGIYTDGVIHSEDELSSLFEYAEQASDIQVAYVHWGTEYQSLHSIDQELLAHVLINVGADVIIGHHPHVVQDIEIYAGVPIFYSLGNFIFDQYFDPEVQQGLWVEIRPNDSGIEYLLQGITSIGSQSVPRFMSEYENATFLESLAEKSSDSLQEMIRTGVIQ